MSYWTEIIGTITVTPMGRTQAEKRYILETVLNHLPLVTGSERDMTVHIIQQSGCDCSSSCDEFGVRTNNLVNIYGDHSYNNGWLDTQSTYILVVEGKFRDRLYNETYKEFMRWLCRLSKRVEVSNVLVNINSDDKGSHIISEHRRFSGGFSQMFEMPSWCKGYNENNWCEYLMWEQMEDSEFPKKLASELPQTIKV